MRRKIKELTDDQWREKLTPAAYHVLRESGTERAFSGDLNSEKGRGNFVCAGCGTILFESDAKFDSGSGWPSFYQPIDEKAGKMINDRSYGMARTEYRCSNCGGHLGHVFPDGPAPTGQRYCINSAALEFVPDAGVTSEK